MQENDVIVAIATAPGRGGVGIVRLSGPNLSGFAFSLTGKNLVPRCATYAHFQEADHSTIEAGLAIYFVGPRSFTGEDVLELQAHGGPVVLNMLQNRCVALGARLAEPGEFTKRAFLNGRLDLAQAESVADIIDATSEQAVRSAVKSLQGVFSAEITHLVEQLIQLRMLVEASLDFPEEDLDFLHAADAKAQLYAIQQQLAHVLTCAHQGKLLREGIQVVLIGQPNVGKSSLLNRLAGFDAAIVTDIAGTTRDTVREIVHLEGVPVHIIDTAGLRDTDDHVEQIGIARTWAAIAQADLVLLLIDSTHGISSADRAILSQLPQPIPCVYVYNKVDLTSEAAGKMATEGQITIRLSAKTGEGIGTLRDTLLELVGWQQREEGVFMARARHLDAIRRAAVLLDEANGHYYQLEFLAESLRLAQAALSEITGKVTADDLLGEIFSRFCIGK